LERSWYAAVTDEDAVVLEAREETLVETFRKVGLRAEHHAVDPTPDDQPILRHTRKYVRLGNGDYAASLVLRRWPREVAPGWLGQALATDIPATVAVHIRPQDPQAIARYLKGQVGWQSVGSRDAASDLGIEDAENVRRALIARTDRPVSVAVVFTVRAPDQKRLNRYVERLLIELGLTLGDVRVIDGEHDLGWQATSLGGACEVQGAWKTLDCTSVASTWLFQPATVFHHNGADVGVTQDGAMLVRIDPFDETLESFGIVVVAKVGAGKSYFLKLLSSRLVGVEVWAVEQWASEYAGVATGGHLSLSGYLTDAEKADALEGFLDSLLATADDNPRPILLILDECWNLLKKPRLAAKVELLARRGRHSYISVCIATQQVRDLLITEEGASVINNAKIIVYLKQQGPDVLTIAEKMHLPPEARLAIRRAVVGQALIAVNDMLVPVDIQASPAEHALITTDPRQRRTAA